MPQETNVDLPSGVPRVLPEHAQDVYRAAFNSAWSAGNSQCQRILNPFSGPCFVSAAYVTH